MVFSKLYFKNYNSALSRNKVLKYWEQSINRSTKIFVPPFTPLEVLDKYADKIIQTPFIVNGKNTPTNQIEKNIKKEVDKIDRKFKILIIDSGSRVLLGELKKILKESKKKMSDFHIWVPSTFTSIRSENISILPEKSIFSKYIPHADVVIGRAGFNTISECLFHKTPIILLSEHGNPETKENIFSLVTNNLGHYYNINEDKLHIFLPKYFERMHGFYKDILDTKKFKFNGSDFIANKIISLI